MKKYWAIGLAAILLAAGGITAAQLGKNKAAAPETKQMMDKTEGVGTEDGITGNKTMEDKKDAMVPIDSGEGMTKNETMMPEEKTAGQDKMMDSAPAMEKTAGAYKDYSPGALAEAAKDGGKTVLFFWAAWCPYCKTANEDFTANAAQIPTGVTVLKVNYDTEKELKTKYGVTYQHTFVQVDASGSQITKWNGGGVKELAANVK